MSNALTGAYQGSFEPRVCASRSEQSAAILEDLAKGSPDELYLLSRYQLLGVAVKRELFTLAA
tara:strand:+ start:528 stop:716 length:189 start_codon:yes stop_codon:yes gene_type:complete